MHEHRRLGVPVRLGADVDAGDDDVDLAARLGEADDPPQRRDPVHVLGARVHGDLRPGGDREPLDGDVELRQVERGDHARALRLGERAEPTRRVAQQRHAQHALGVALGAVADQPDDDARRVGGDRAVDQDEVPVLAEVVLLEVAVEQLDDLGRVHEPAAARR